MTPNGKEDSSEGPDGHPEHMIYCQRAQSKAERQAELRAKFQSMDASKGGVNLYVKRLGGCRHLEGGFILESNGRCCITVYLICNIGIVLAS